MPAQGGRYPVGTHDRPLRWRLYMGGESPRQGFFARKIMLTPPEIRGSFRSRRAGVAGKASLPANAWLTPDRARSFPRLRERVRLPATALAHDPRTGVAVGRRTESDEGDFDEAWKPVAAVLRCATSAALGAQAQDVVDGTDVDEILNIARGYGSATLETQSNGDPRSPARSRASPTRSSS